MIEPPPREIYNWFDVGAYLRLGGRVVKSVEENGIEALRVDVASDGTMVPIVLRRLRAPNGGAWLALAGHVGPATRLKHRAALVANLTLPIGALTIWKEQLFLRQTLPLVSLRERQLERALRALAATTAELKALAAGDASTTPSPFAYLFA